MLLPLSRDLAVLRPTLIRQLVDAAPPGAVNLGLGQPMLDPPPALSTALATAAFERATYSANAGIPALREAVAAAHRVDAAQVLVTAGAEQALFLAICGTLEPGQTLLSPAPGFPVYELIANWRGARSRDYRLMAEDQFRLRAAQVIEELDGAAAIVLASPANPTGAMHSESELRLLLEALEHRGIPYISDDVYASLGFAGECVLPRQLSPNGISIGSLSKSHALMGWRLGWLIASAEWVRGIIPLQQMTLTCASVPIQRAAVHAFSPQGVESSRAIAAELRRRRDLALEFVAELPDVPLPASDGGLYLFTDLSAYGSDDVALAHRFLDGGVIVIPGQAFGPAGKGFVRISFGVEEDELREGFARLKRALGRVSHSQP
ncbi:MAG: hypothetical protein AUK47_21710 [Deltaproteobacteria bacterium CG2_30_63_29]|nr:MAG: hypothetical protein AUK47_21710 [Deltaproteobacteria bacterium CG2_30_63_29]PIW00048.1 MAG: hypothetical protein COW42_09125 [Deltaproteobacteria bacterium CG17_big_fil_post_rev_8_21_14_2_50_63_7]PJB46589.1 MAG: hypothetical protein CO108_05640 [Deltaproteobacteria bacterium CG_4_9_14_3_um_filter_63_12]